MTTTSNHDISLDDPTPASQPPQPPTVFGDPNGPTPPVPVKFLSVDEVLTSAKRHRTVARICLRADLQAEYDSVLVELAGMVDAQGKVLEQTDGSLSGDELAHQAQAKADRLSEIRREMNAAMRDVVFEGMAEDEWRPWYEKHYPKGQEPDLTVFNNLLIARVAVQPTLTVDEIKDLRGVLGAPQITEMANQAWMSCTKGGVDIPKSPAFLQRLQLR